MSGFASKKWAVSLMAGCALSALSGLAFADELEPAGSELPPPSYDRPNDNPPAKANAEKGRSAKNLVYLELLGNGGLYSVNYERMLTDDLSARLGFSYLTFGASASNGSDTSSVRGTLVTAPVLVNYTVGGENHRAEFGAGATLVYMSASANGSGVSESGEGVAALATGVIGYRYSPKHGGFVFRAGFTPLAGKGGFMPWGGMSFGGTF
jgi:hypothetical protein